jgi:hypothetical protein
LRVRLKLVVLEVADHLGVTKACRELNVPRSSFYCWKQKYAKAGRSGLYRERPVPYRHPRRTSAEVVERITVSVINIEKRAAIATIPSGAAPNGISFSALPAMPP